MNTRYFLMPLTAAVLMVAACSDSNTTRSSTESAGATVGDAPTTTAGQDTVAPTPSTVADITDVAHDPATGEFVGALVDVTDQTCESEADGWHVSGTATNPTSEPVDYRIYISLINEATTTRALVETEVLAVAPQASGSYDELISLPDGDLHCVLRVERRPSAP